MRVTPRRVVRVVRGRIIQAAHRGRQARRARAQRVPDGPALFCFGASYMSGLDDGTDPWPVLVARDLGLPLINRAVGGDTSRDARRRARLVGGRPDARDLVLVEVGLNDMLRWGHRPDTLARLRRRLDEIVATVGSAGAPVRVICDGPIPDWSAMPRGHDHCDDERYAAFREVPLSYPGAIDLAQGWDPATMVLPDLLHPNLVGVDAMAATVLAALKPD